MAAKPIVAAAQRLSRGCSFADLTNISGELVGQADQAGQAGEAKQADYSTDLKELADYTDSQLLDDYTDSQLLDFPVDFKELTDTSDSQSGLLADTSADYSADLKEQDEYSADLKELADRVGAFGCSRCRWAKAGCNTCRLIMRRSRSRSMGRRSSLPKAAATSDSLAG